MCKPDSAVSVNPIPPSSGRRVSGFSTEIQHRLHIRGLMLDQPELVRHNNIYIGVVLEV